MRLILFLVASLLRLLPPEFAHKMTVRGLKLAPLALLPKPAAASDPVLGQRLWGLEFANPLGLAAGFDKGGEVMDPLLRLGFGFVELGSVTPLPQPGNSRPRLFRLTEDRAVINRMGFNSEGLEVVRERLQGHGADNPGLIGVNLGANKDSADRAADYEAGLRGFAGLADFFVINISSPNTPGLRDLQGGDALRDLLARAIAARGDDPVPLLVKIAPDLDQQGEAEIADIMLSFAGDETRRGVDGLIVSNTTIGGREDLLSEHGCQRGGLSGAPLFAPSTEMLARMYIALGHKMPLIGVGGVGSGAEAYTKICAGASLVELYSALVFEGPGLVAQINREVAASLKADGFSNISEAVGTRAKEWAERD